MARAGEGPGLATASSADHSLSGLPAPDGVPLPGLELPPLPASLPEPGSAVPLVLAPLVPMGFLSVWVDFLWVDLSWV